MTLTLERLIAQLFDNQPDSVIWYKPVFADGGDDTIIDLEVQYANNTAARTLGVHTTELLGKRLRSTTLMDSDTIHLVLEQCIQVWHSGKPKEHTYYNAHFNRYLNEQRSRVEDGILSITRDCTDQAKSELQLQRQEQKYHSIIDQSTDGIILLEPILNEQGTIIDFRFVYCNRCAIEVGTLPWDFEGKTLLQVLPHLVSSEQFQLHRQVALTCEPVRYETTFRTKDGKEYGWFIVTLSKADDNVVSRFVDISERKRNEQTISQQAEKLDQIINASLNAIFTCEAIRDEKGRIVDLRYTQINDMYKKLIGKTEGDVIGKTMLELFPTAKTTGAFDTHCRVIDTGIPARFDVRYQGEGLDAWYDISSVRVGANSVVVTFADVLEQKKAVLEIEQQRNLLNNILTNSSNGISVGKVIRDTSGNICDFRTILVNDAAVNFIGVPKNVYLSKTGSEIDPSFVGSPYFQQCVKCMETSEPFVIQYHLQSVGRWLEVTVSKMDEEHQIYIFTDVTPIKEAQLALERNAQQLQTIIDRTQAGVFTLAPVRDEEGSITDFRFVLANRTLAAYVKQEPESLIGTLGSQWFTGYKTNGLFELFCKTYETRQINRFDFHYNTDGIDAWIDMLCTHFEDEIIITFTDYTPVKKLQLELQKTVEELKQSNESLEEFAYAASHDLQEPLRKIHTFTDRLKMTLFPHLNEAQQGIFERIESATMRMRHLIEDLLAYSQVSRQAFAVTPVDLNKVLEAVMQDLEVSINETSAVISAESLPVITGDERQLHQLFQNLLGNAIKYSKPDVAPEVSVTCSIVQGQETEEVALSNRVDKYYQIKVQDNGIGFEQTQAEKIFEVFHRLHGRADYEGTGIGLAIVQRVVQNHNGYITAEGRPGEGATFNVLLPVLITTFQ